MSTQTKIARLRAFCVARLGDVKRAVAILVAAGESFALAVRRALSFQSRVSA